MPLGAGVGLGQWHALLHGCSQSPQLAVIRERICQILLHRPPSENFYTKLFDAGLYLCCHLANAFAMRRIHQTNVWSSFIKTRNSAVAERPRDASCQFHSNYNPVLYQFRDKARCWSKIVISLYSCIRRPPIFLLEYCHNVWYRKTRMVELSDGVICLRICLADQHNTGV